MATLSVDVHCDNDTRILVRPLSVAAKWGRARVIIQADRSTVAIHGTRQQLIKLARALQEAADLLEQAGRSGDDTSDTDTADTAASVAAPSDTTEEANT